EPDEQLGHASLRSVLASGGRGAAAAGREGGGEAAACVPRRGDPGGAGAAADGDGDGGGRGRRPRGAAGAGESGRGGAGGGGAPGGLAGRDRAGDVPARVRAGEEVMVRPVPPRIPKTPSGAAAVPSSGLQTRPSVCPECGARHSL